MLIMKVGLLPDAAERTGSGVSPRVATPARELLAVKGTPAERTRLTCYSGRASTLNWLIGPGRPVIRLLGLVELYG